MGSNPAAPTKNPKITKDYFTGIIVVDVEASPLGLPGGYKKYFPGSAPGLATAGRRSGGPIGVMTDRHSHRRAIARDCARSSRRRNTNSAMRAGACICSTWHRPSNGPPTRWRHRLKNWVSRIKPKSGRTTANHCHRALVLPSTIFRASVNASVGVGNVFVAASFNPSSSYMVTMKPTWRVRSSR